MKASPTAKLAPAQVWRKLESCPSSSNGWSRCSKGCRGVRVRVGKMPRCKTIGRERPRGLAQGWRKFGASWRKFGASLAQVWRL